MSVTMSTRIRRNERNKRRVWSGVQETVVEKIKKMRLRWFGQCGQWSGWMEKDYQSRLYTDTSRKIINKGRKRKIWMDNVREELKEKNIILIGNVTRNREFLLRSLARAS